MRRGPARSPPRWASLAVAAVALLAAASAGRAAGFRKGPYLIYPGTASEMTVLWQADSTPRRSYAEWGPTAGCGNPSLPLTENAAGDDEHRFAHTITGLTPGARYHYRVHVDANSAGGSFLAAPAAGATSVTIYALGDTRSYPRDFDKVCRQMFADRVGTVPGSVRRGGPPARPKPPRRGEGPKGAARVRPPAPFPPICLHAGDWVNCGGVESEWDDQFFVRSKANIAAFLSHVPVMGCRGNHEGSGALLRKYYPYGYRDATGCYYSFDYGPVHVTVIDQYVSYWGGSAQHTWVRDDLLGSSKPWKIVVFHEPAWSAGGSHGNDLTAQNELCPLFVAGGVSVVVGGHNHYYARCEVDGIQHLTLGGGGAPLYRHEMTGPNLVAAERTLHFARFDFSDAAMTVTIVRADGTVVESFSVRGRGPVGRPKSREAKARSEARSKARREAAEREHRRRQAAEEAVAEEAANVWAPRLLARVREAVAAKTKFTFESRMLRGRVKITRVGETGGVQISDRAGRLTMDVELVRLPLGDRRYLALALLRGGNPDDHCLAAFYCLAAGDTGKGGELLRKGGEGAEEVRAFFRGIQAGETGHEQDAKTDSDLTAPQPVGR